MISVIIYFYLNNKNSAVVAKLEKTEILVTDSAKKESDSTAILKIL
ncbi:hypothetical protein [Chryseobacterium foetidum]|nr:hypothetical protein [Chryseobacterium foetidum]